MDGGAALLLASFPSHGPQRLVTAASQDYNEGQYLQHNEFMYTWTIPSACFRERRTRPHTYTHVERERERERRHARTVERIKMALSSICGMTSAGRWGLRGGSEGKRPG